LHMTQTVLHSSPWGEWIKKQERSLREYTCPETKGQEYSQAVAAEFHTFCDPSGIILDIGCGIQPRPAYVTTWPGTTYVGIDPLQGNERRAFPFVRAIGEMLPFRPATFDWALSATSLDHFAEPLSVLAQVRHALKPSGHLGLWVGVVDPNYFRRKYAFPSLRNPRNWARLWTFIQQGNLKRAASVAWRHLVGNRVQSILVRRQQATDERALIDKVFAERATYHFRFYKEEEVPNLLVESGYQVTRHRLITDAEHGNSLFVVARPQP